MNHNGLLSGKLNVFLGDCKVKIGDGLCII